MTVNQYKDVTWGPSPEPLDIGKLNTMAANTRYVYENLPKMTYRPWSGAGRDQGIKVACGVAAVPGNSSSYLTYITVNYGGFFTPGCRPVITMSLQSPGHRRILPTFYGIDGVDTSPDHRGFGAAIAAVPGQTNKTNPLEQTFHLHWIAIGY